MSISGFRAAFFFVIALLAGTAAFTLWSEIRTNEQVDTFVSQALARDVLIGRIRVDALQLEDAVDEHIRAGSDDERSAADARMASILEDITVASSEYTRELPPSEGQIWKQFNDTSHALAAQVRTAVRYSNRKEAERARKHLVEEIRPVTAALDLLAEELSQKNADDTKDILKELEALRVRSTAAGALVAVGAVIVSLIIGLRMTSLLGRQDQTIAEQLKELDRRNQELDAFASRVAHDLVAPLAPLKGYLTLIRRSMSVSDAGVKEMLSQAEQSATRMAELVEALLRFCRAGNRTDPTAAEFDTAVSTILTEVAQVAERDGVKLERDLMPHTWVATSAPMLQSIAQNLLSNAVKYSAGRKDAKVTVRLFREKGEAVLEVTDNGVGLSEQSQRALFQPFFRAPETKGLPGHGLGLATTKRLVEAHNGSIQVRSAQGVGTQFSVRLPLAQPPDARASSETRAAQPQLQLEPGLSKVANS
ncbi:MAG: ATP-binding protein [Myxococcaceae bacterium]